MTTKNCLFCGKTIIKPQTESLKDWINRHKYCSRQCSYDAKKGKLAWNSGKTITNDSRIKPAWNKGLTAKIDKRVKKYGLNQRGKKRKPLSIEHKLKNSADKNNNWKGDEAGSRSMHLWVERQKGKARTHICEECNKNQAIHWSNIDHKYRRNADDYRALCARCHELYDMKFNNKHASR